MSDPSASRGRVGAAAVVAGRVGVGAGRAKTRIVHLAVGGERFDFLGFHHRLVGASGYQSVRLREPDGARGPGRRTRHRLPAVGLHRRQPVPRRSQPGLRDRRRRLCCHRPRGRRRRGVRRGRTGTRGCSGRDDSGVSTPPPTAGTWESPAYPIRRATRDPPGSATRPLRDAAVPLHGETLLDELLGALALACR